MENVTLINEYYGIINNDPNVYDKKFKLAEGITINDDPDELMMPTNALYILKKYPHKFYDMNNNPNHVDIDGTIDEPTILFKMNPIDTYDLEDRFIVLAIILENCIYFTVSLYTPIRGNNFIEHNNVIIDYNIVGGRRHRKSHRKTKRRHRTGRKSRRHH